MLRFATIGTNTIVDKLLSAAKSRDVLKHTCVYSRREDTARAFAEKHGVEKIHTDLLSLAEDPDIDAVYIASPNSLHCEQSVLMLSHGKHVLCEKPIAVNSGELSRMRAAAEKGGAVLMEAMRSVYDPMFIKAAELIDRIGTPRRVIFEYSQFSARYEKYRNGVVTNAFDPDFCGGSLMDIGVYCVHPLVKLFGMPDRICSDALLLDNGLDGEGVIHAYYTSGLQAELIYSKITDGYSESQIQGEKGTITLDTIHNPQRVTLRPRGGEAEVYTLEKAWNMEYELDEWLRQINGAPDTLDVSRMELAVMDEARRQTGMIFPCEKQGISAK